MDIKKIISDYHNASEIDKVLIEKQVEREFSMLSENEKKEVQQIFLESFDNTIEKAKDLLKEINLKIESDEFN